MNVSEHAKILKSYIDRLSIKDIQDILYHYESCHQESLNGNTNSQKSADVILQGAILNALVKMLPSDRDNITSIIDKTLNRKG